MVWVGVTEDQFETCFMFGLKMSEKSKAILVRWRTRKLYMCEWNADELWRDVKCAGLKFCWFCAWRSGGNGSISNF